MASVKAFLVAIGCGLVLWGAMSVQARGLGGDRQFGGPICLESPEVHVIGNPCPPPPR
jgi:hypothetical protein